MKPKLESIDAPGGITVFDHDPVATVIIYDCRASARQAIQLTRRVAAHLTNRVELHPNLWRFDLLEDRAIYEHAVLRAVESEILLVAMSSSSDLPERVRKWLDDVFVRRRPQKTALVALFEKKNASDVGEPLALQRLTVLAHNAGADLFARQFTSEPVKPGEAPQTFVRGTPFNSTRWGINE